MCVINPACLNFVSSTFENELHAVCTVLIWAGFEYPRSACRPGDKQWTSVVNDSRRLRTRHSMAQVLRDRANIPLDTQETCHGNVTQQVRQAVVPELTFAASVASTQAVDKAAERGTDQ
jgi:hypothetical protein